MPCGGGVRGADGIGKLVQGGGQIVPDRRHLEQLAARRRLHHRPVPVRERRHREQGTDEDQLFEAFQECHAHLKLVGDRLDDGAARTACPVARRERLAQQRRACLRRDSARGLQRLAVQRGVAQHQASPLAVAQQPGGMIDRVLRQAGTGLCHGGRGRQRILPVAVGRGDDRADSPGLRQHRGLRAQRPQLRGAARFLAPVRHNAGEIADPPVDEFMLRVVWLMIGGIGADDIDQRRIGAPSVVQHGDPVREPASDMEQREGRDALHACIAVGRPRHHVLLQAEDRPYRVRQAHFIDQLHFRRAGVGETGRDPGISQGLEERLRSVHRSCCLALFATGKRASVDGRARGLTPRTSARPRPRSRSP